MRSVMFLPLELKHTVGYCPCCFNTAVIRPRSVKKIGTDTSRRTLKPYAHQLDHYGKALGQTYWQIAREPVPERWVDLITRLDAEEAQKGDQIQQSLLLAR